MAYKRAAWADHVVQYPTRFTETTNGDGTVTHTPAPGTLVQQGTPVSAANLNNIEEGLQHRDIAAEWIYSVQQAQIRDLTARLVIAEAKLVAHGI